MTTRKKIKHKGRMLGWLLAKMALMISFAAEAQEDSMEERRRLKCERHVGYCLPAGARGHYNSDVHVHDGRAAHRKGKSIGFTAATSLDAAGPTVGLYYASTPFSYSVNALQGSVSGSIYPLKLRRSEDHLFEPYVSVTASLHSIVVEDYLLEKASRRLNAFGEHLPGHQVTHESLVSLGVQYEMKSKSLKALRLFAELRYGDSLIDRASTRFATADARQPFEFSLGVNFGKSR